MHTPLGRWSAGVLPVSVVIPAFNAAPFIAETLESVRAQSASPAEIIVVDDGSTDATAEVATGHGARVVRQTNQGVAAARTTGIATSSGEWVAFLDADDLWTPDKLARQWDAAQACPEAGLLFTDFARFTAAGIQIPSMFSWRANYRRVVRHEVSPSIVRYDHDSLLAGFLEGNFISASSWLIRRSALDRAGPLAPELGGYCEDREFLLRLLHVTTAAGVEEVLNLVRLRGDSLSSSQVNMHLGRVMVGEQIMARPEHYPRAALAHARATRAVDLRRAGLQLLQEDRVREARGILVKSLRARPSLKLLLLLGWSLSGARMFRRALAISRVPGP